MKRFECVCVVCGKTFMAGKSTAQCCSQACRNKKALVDGWDNDERPCVVRRCSKDASSHDCASGCAEWHAWFYRRWRQIRRAAGIKESEG